MLDTIHRARYAIEQRLVMDRRHSNISASSSGSSRTGTPNDKVSQEALSILAHLKSLMWENVGVVRTPAKLSNAVSELSAICDQADRLWMENGGGSAGWEVIALRDASRAGLAVAESALANRVSGGAHYVVLDEEDDEEEEVGRRKDIDEEEDDVLVVARA